MGGGNIKHAFAPAHASETQIKRHKKLPLFTKKADGSAFGADQLQRVSLFDFKIETVLRRIIPQLQNFQTFGISRFFAVGKKIVMFAVDFFEFFQVAE